MGQLAAVELGSSKTTFTHWPAKKNTQQQPVSWHQSAARSAVAYGPKVAATPNLK